MDIVVILTLANIQRDFFLYSSNSRPPKYNPKIYQNILLSVANSWTKDGNNYGTTSYSTWPESLHFFKKRLHINAVTVMTVSYFICFTNGITSQLVTTFCNMKSANFVEKCFSKKNFKIYYILYNKDNNYIYLIYSIYYIYLIDIDR